MTEQETASREEEIDLRQYWLALERQWKLIATLCVSSVVTAVILSLYLPKVYCVTTTISQGRVVMGDQGERVTSVTNLADIQQMISTGNFIKSMLSALNLEEAKYGGIFRQITFETRENSENILIRYETPEPDLGVRILNKLNENLQNTFNQRATKYRDCRAAEAAKVQGAINVLQLGKQKAALEIQRLTQEITKKEQIAQINVAILMKEKTSYADQITRLTDRIKAIMVIKNKLSDMSARIEPNTMELLKGKTWLTGNTQKGDVLTSILYANNIQQNLNFLTLYYERIKDFEVDASECEQDIIRLKNQLAALDERVKEITVTKEAEVMELHTKMQETKLGADEIIPAEIEKLRSEIAGLEAQKSLIEGIKVISAPDYVNASIKPNRRMIVASVGALSLLLGILIAFFIEWREDHQERLAQSNSAATLQNRSA